MEQFLKYVGVLAGIYVAQTGFKIASTRKSGSFDFKKLIDGIIDHIIRFASILVFFYVGSFISDKQIIPLGDKTLTIDDALTAFAYGLIVIQSISLFGNIREAYQIEDEDIVKHIMENPKEIG